MFTVYMALWLEFCVFGAIIVLDKYGTRLFHGIGVKYQQMFIICSNATQMVYKELLYDKEGQSM